jgi:drug/metabolite transporter (DMT)-like permease
MKSGMQEERDDNFVLLIAVFIVVLWAPLAAYTGQGIGSWGLQEWGLVLASGVVHLIYFRTLLRGYREADLTVVYPVARGSGPLLSAGGAILLLQETLTLSGVLGVLGVVAGIFLLSWGGAGQKIRLGIKWGLATGALIALYTVIDGIGVKKLGISPILLDFFGNAIRIPFMLPQALANPEATKRCWREHHWAILLLAAISPLGYVLVLYAVKLAPLSHVAPARELSMLVAALLGGKLLQEQEQGRRLLGAACICSGVILLAL